MEEKDPDHIARPGVPEALDPDIGNGSLWETNPHDFNLKNVDPLHHLDNLLLEDSVKEKIISQWNGINEEATDENSSLYPNEDNTSESEGDTITGKRTTQISTRNKAIETFEVEWAENEKAPETEPEEQPSPIPEDVVEAKEPVGEDESDPLRGKVGKRVRKVVKKARKEASALQDVDQPSHETVSGDESLSPYTRWLKGLRGTDYVHPYDDDYALDQKSTMARGVVSETFADLLASQGHKDKAIEMYIQLMEKYPEKSSFFAAKIEALK